MTSTKVLPAGLVLRPLRNEVDRERFTALSTLYNNPSEGATCACLLHHHPETTLDDYWVVEDSAKEEIVSSTCLIPWTCSFAGLDLRAAQLEMVLTHPDYRGRGLVRAQIDNFELAVKSRGYDLSIIWGIPYYYRQYGYAYAVDGEVRESLPSWKIPPAPEESSPPLYEPSLEITLRPARIADIPGLVESYTQTTQSLDFFARRTPTYWRYLIEAAQHPIQIVESAQSGEMIGFVTLQRSGECVTILECGLKRADVALALLQILKSEGAAQIQVSWPTTTPLARLARSLGSQTVPGGQWLLRLPDVVGFLNKISPVFETRLAASPWHGHNGELTINLFRQAYRLRFQNGKMAGVDGLGFVDTSMGSDGGELCLPPEAFVRLLFGFRRIDELLDAWPDITVKPRARNLIETLFPPQASYLYTPYHFMG